MATPALALDQLAAECEPEGLTPKNGERIGLELAKLFNVQPDEVGILRLQKQSLMFVYPAKLHSVGNIPVNNSGAVAARTANSKRAEVMNTFAQTKHVSLFETVDLSDKPKQMLARNAPGAKLIQKLMCAPVLGAGGVLGVIEVCRKGTSASAAGPDFSSADLQKLVSTAGALAKCFK